MSKKFFSKNREYYLSLLLMIVVCTAFTLVYINRVFTDVVGWNVYNAVVAVKQNLMIYRDFESYVPPAFFLQLKWTYQLFGGSFMAFRIVGVVQRILLFYFIFKILVHWYRPRYVWLGCTAGYVLMCTAAYDGFGDYSQVSMLCMVIAVYCGVLYTEHWDLSAKGIGQIALIGIFASLSLLFKQSYGVLFIAALFAALVVLCIARRDRAWVVKFLVAGIAWFLPIVITALILWTEDALIPCIEQVFFNAVNSKGISESLPVKLAKGLFTYKQISLSGSLLLTLVLGVDGFRRKDLKEIGITLLAGVLFIGTLFSQWGADLQGLVLIAGKYHYLTLAAFPILTGISAVFWYQRRKEEREFTIDEKSTFGSVFVAIHFFLAFFFATALDVEGIDLLYHSFSISKLATACYYFGFYVTFLAAAYETITRLFRKKPLFSDGIYLYLVMVMTVILGNAISSGNGGITSSTTIFSVPLVVCILLTHVIRDKKIGYFGIVTVVWIMLFLTMVQKLITPYSWWGWTAEPISDATNYTMESDLVKGFRVSKQTKIKIDEITHLIERNSEKDDYVLCFPYSVVFNMLADRTNEPTRTYVYFFDVCSDQAAQSDLEIMKQHKPKVIVWKEMSESAWTTHEDLFRGGNRLGQRDIQDWYEEVKDTEYTLIGQIDNQYVYRLNDGTPINYTFFPEKEDLESVEDEVIFNNPDYNLIHSVLHRFGITGHMPEEQAKDTYLILIGISVFAMFFLRYLKEFSRYILALISVLSLYFTHDSIYFFLYLIPLALMLPVKKGEITVGKIVYLLLTAVVAAAGFFTWGDHAIPARDAAIIAIAMILAISSLECLVNAFCAAKERRALITGEEKRFLNKYFVHLALTVIILCVVQLGGSYRYRISSGQEAADLEQLRIVLDGVQNGYNTVYDAVYAYMDEEERGAIGGSGVNYGALKTCYEKAGVQMPELGDFVGEKAKGLTDENVYIRISGPKITVWLQKNTEIGNSGWAISRIWEEKDFKVSNQD